MANAVNGLPGIWYVYNKLSMDPNQSLEKQAYYKEQSENILTLLMNMTEDVFREEY